MASRSLVQSVTTRVGLIASYADDQAAGGDPGSSQFYVSLEDDLMRLFGSDRIAKPMDRMGVKGGEVIQHSAITANPFERASKKVGKRTYFGIRVAPTRVRRCHELTT